MKIQDFRQMYLKELLEARSVEAQLCDALPRMKDIASGGDLKAAIYDHLYLTRIHLERIDTLIANHGADGDHTDQSIERLLAESEGWTGMLGNAALRDAGLIASLQRIEHYEIAIYGTLACWAKQLGHDRDVQTLLMTLDEEKAADDRLSGLAKREVNPEAA